MNLMEIFWEQWELDGNSTPYPFQKIKTIPLGRVGCTQLAFLMFYPKVLLRASY
jgi:hypothetical protein